MSSLGIHILVDMEQCDPDVLNSVETVQACLIEAARVCGATIVSHCFHHFSPHGVSGVVVIAESHLAIHTWPEHGFAAVDLFSCGDSLDPDACIAYLKTAFGSQRSSTRQISRGTAEHERGATSNEQAPA